jgi:hypothetical protein
MPQKWIIIYFIKDKHEFYNVKIKTLEHVRFFHIKKVALNMTIFVINVAKMQTK